MNTNQPKYITYKGTRYQRVDSINEIEVRNIAPTDRHCYFEYDRYRAGIYELQFYRPGLSIVDILKSKNVLNAEIDGTGDFFLELGGTMDEADDYTYTGPITVDLDITYILCTRNKGVGKRIYELAEAYSKVSIEHTGKGWKGLFVLKPDSGTEGATIRDKLVNEIENFFEHYL